MTISTHIRVRRLESHEIFPGCYTRCYIFWSNWGCGQPYGASAPIGSARLETMRESALGTELRHMAKVGYHKLGDSLRIPLVSGGKSTCGGVRLVLDNLQQVTRGTVRHSALLLPLLNSAQ